jgi:hypothetical protein
LGHRFLVEFALGGVGVLGGVGALGGVGVLGGVGALGGVDALGGVGALAVLCPLRAFGDLGALAVFGDLGGLGVFGGLGSFFRCFVSHCLKKFLNGSALILNKIFTSFNIDLALAALPLIPINSERIVFIFFLSGLSFVFQIKSFVSLAKLANAYIFLYNSSNSL